jgi:hypothetical protein
MRAHLAVASFLVSCGQPTPTPAVVDESHEDAPLSPTITSVESDQPQPDGLAPIGLLTIHGNNLAGATTVMVDFAPLLARSNDGATLTALIPADTTRAILRRSSPSTVRVTTPGGSAYLAITFARAYPGGRFAWTQAPCDPAFAPTIGHGLYGRAVSVSDVLDPEDLTLDKSCISGATVALYPPDTAIPEDTLNDDDGPVIDGTPIATAITYGPAGYQLAAAPGDYVLCTTAPGWLGTHAFGCTRVTLGDTLDGWTWSTGFAPAGIWGRD